ncbi:MAG: hypothetical protein Q7S30_02675 [Candidatus Omnitrophota bacterium]|nr:hypothetical protein [Candidatus Omnitrophota bacterium]
MRLSVKLLMVSFIAMLLYGCDSNQYQIVTGPEGMLYRLNKKTGTLSIITEGGRISQPAQSQKPESVKEDQSSRLDEPIIWKESKYPGKELKARFEMMWRENKLCYKFSVYPYKSLEKIFTRKKQDYIYSLMRPGFTLELVDKNGFLVKEIKVNLWSMTKVNGDDGAPKELILNSQIDCTKQSYRSIGGYTIKWGLDGELIEDDGADFIKSSSIKSER